MNGPTEHPSAQSLQLNRELLLAQLPQVDRDKLRVLYAQATKISGEVGQRMGASLDDLLTNYAQRVTELSSITTRLREQGVRHSELLRRLSEE